MCHTIKQWAKIGKRSVIIVGKCFNFTEHYHLLPWPPGEISIPLSRRQEGERRNTTAWWPRCSPFPHSDTDVQLAAAKLHRFSHYRLGGVAAAVGDKLWIQDGVPDAVQAASETGETRFVRQGCDISGEAKFWGERSEVHGGDAAVGSQKSPQGTLGVLWFSCLP